MISFPSLRKHTMPSNAPTRRRLRIPAISIAALVILALLVAYFALVLARSAEPSGSPIIPESAIPKTSCSDPYSQVVVTDLAQDKWTSCDMKGHVVVFLDGVTAEVGEVGAITGPPGGNGPLPDHVSYVVENLGKYGVIAVRTDHGHRQYWGSSRGIDLLKKTPKGI